MIETRRRTTQAHLSNPHSINSQGGHIRGDHFRGAGLGTLWGSACTAYAFALVPAPPAGIPFGQVGGQPRQVNQPMQAEGDDGSFGHLVEHG